MTITYILGQFKRHLIKRLKSWVKGYPLPSFFVEVISTKFVLEFF